MADARAGGAPSGVSSASSAGGTDGALLDGGAFLLQLLQKPPQAPQQQTQPSPASHFDPAVAAVGPALPFLPQDFLNHQPPPGHFPDPILFPSPPDTSLLGFSHAGAFGPSMWSAPQLPLPPGFPSLGGGGGDLANHLHHHQQQQQQYSFFQFGHERPDLGLPGNSSIGDLGGNVFVGRDQVIAAALGSRKLQESGPPWGHEERQGGSMRPPPPGFRAPAGRDAELDNGLVKWDRGAPRQDGRSAQMMMHNERPTAPIGQNHHQYQHRHSIHHQQNSLGDRGANVDSQQQRAGLEKGMLSGHTSAIKRSEQQAAVVERRETGHGFERKEENNQLQTFADEILLNREILFGDFQGKFGSFAGKLENQRLTVSSDLPVDHNLHSVNGNTIRDIKHDLNHEVAGYGKVNTVQRLEVLNQDDSDELSPERDLSGEEDEMIDKMIKSLNLTAEKEVKNVIAQGSSRSKDFRSDFSRGLRVSSLRMRIHRRTIQCRRDIDAFSPRFLSIFESLVPAEEEKEKQKQLLLSLSKLITKEWPSAKLFLYGSCANSFGVSNSDIDLCLSIDDHEISKSEIILKLADVLQSGNLQNVQALTRARVPIVKMMDPATGLSCDICINNLLAVVNTKLLKDYAQIDHRLQQLAFIVKHWAKSRRVNETYQGTLSSYAYVLMCIHFLQQRRPAILPCLQAMETTYAVRVDDIDCAFYDQVEMLQAFGSRNRESIARLVWAFFHYWAYHHDYANDVISVRTGGMISKQSKDWTRRVGNDRHLICIEDPFEVSHDLGRVVDKFSIKILREEFERAADILQYDHNPTVTLFQPYVRDSPHM